MRSSDHVLQLLVALGLLSVTACGRGPLEQLLATPSGFDGGGEVSDTGVSLDPDGNLIIRDAGVPLPPMDATVRDTGFPPPPPPPPPRDAGPTTQCRSDSDCFRALGQPICPQGQRGDWDCVRNICELRCEGQPECFNDCDCPFELACGGGICRPLNRNNLCCLSPFCPPGSTCELPGGGTSICPEEPPPPPTDGGVPPPPPDAGVTPVGAPCVSNQMCAPFGWCIDEASNGFPDGYCTQACGPQGGMCPPGADCRNFGPQNQLCLDECATSAECRMGYGCVQLGIDPQKVCWPISPGSTNPNGVPVGSSCQMDQECAMGLTCLNFQGWPDGYCTKQYCDPMNNPCPSQSACYAFPGLFSLCLADCPSGGSQSTCRSGYYCFGPTGSPGGCIPN